MNGWMRSVWSRICQVPCHMPSTRKVPAVAPLPGGSATGKAPGGEQARPIQAQTQAGTAEPKGEKPMFPRNNTAVRADGLFVSPLQQSDDPGPGQIRQAVAATLDRYGVVGCAGLWHGVR